MIGSQLNTDVHSTIVCSVGGSADMNTTFVPHQDFDDYGAGSGVAGGAKLDPYLDAAEAKLCDIFNVSIN